jgi:hypothetical protein
MTRPKAYLKAVYIPRYLIEFIANVKVKKVKLKNDVSWDVAQCRYFVE